MSSVISSRQKQFTTYSTNYFKDFSGVFKAELMVYFILSTSMNSVFWDEYVYKRGILILHSCNATNSK